MLRKTLIISLIFLSSCKQEDKNSLSPQPPAFTREAQGQIYRADSIIVKDLDIEIADNEYERETGLMYRETMKPTEGMWFVFPDESPRYFYMRNTLIPLDIIFADKNRTIVSIIKNAQPLNDRSLPSEKPAMYVLELNAGMSDLWDISINDSISVTNLH